MDNSSSAPILNSFRERQKSPSQAKQEDSVELPLEAWSCGLKVHNTGLHKFFFVWSCKKRTVSVRRRSDEGPVTIMEEVKTSQMADIKVCVFCCCTIQVKSHLMSALKATNNLPITPWTLVIQLSTLNYERKGGTAEYYTPGNGATSSA